MVGCLGWDALDGGGVDLVRVVIGLEGVPCDLLDGHDGVGLSCGVV